MSDAKNVVQTTRLPKEKSERNLTSVGRTKEPFSWGLLFIDLFGLVFPTMASLGVLLILIDIMRWFLDFGIVEKNLFTAIGWIALLFFFTIRIWDYFSRRIDRFRHTYVRNREDAEFEKAIKEVTERGELVIHRQEGS